MSPRSDKRFNVSCENGYDGKMSADELGITVCLYAYSNLSFGTESQFTDTCTQQYHWLREYALDHDEAGDIFRGRFGKMSQSTPVMIVVALRIFGVGAEVPHQIKAIKDSPTSSLRCQHVRTI